MRWRWRWLLLAGYPALAATLYALRRSQRAGGALYH